MNHAPAAGLCAHYAGDRRIDGIVIMHSVNVYPSQVEVVLVWRGQA